MDALENEEDEGADGADPIALTDGNAPDESGHVANGSSAGDAVHLEGAGLARDQNDTTLPDIVKPDDAAAIVEPMFVEDSQLDPVLDAATVRELFGSDEEAADPEQPVQNLPCGKAGDGLAVPSVPDSEQHAETDKAPLNLSPGCEGFGALDEVDQLRIIMADLKKEQERMTL